MNAQILLAEDDVNVANVLGEYLTQRSYSVITVTDGYQLAQKAAECRPNLIIADIQMPGAYASAVYEILQKDPKTASIPILFISGHPYEKVKSLLPKDPKTRFLPKPLDYQALQAAIKELLALGGSGGA